MSQMRREVSAKPGAANAQTLDVTITPKILSFMASANIFAWSSDPGCSMYLALVQQSVRRWEKPWRHQRAIVLFANSPEQTKLRIQLEGRLAQRFERSHWVYNSERAGFKMEIPGKHKRRKHGDHTTFRAQGRRRCTVR